MESSLKIKTDTIIRTVILVVAIINQVLAILGRDKLPIYDADITQIITLAVTVGSSIWVWWKNNSFTEEAIRADNYLKALKVSNKK